MLALSKDRELRSQWQLATKLLLGEADVGAFSKQVELALFFDAKLDVAAIASTPGGMVSPSVRAKAHRV